MAVSSDGVVAVIFPFLSDDDLTGGVCRLVETFAALSAAFRDCTLLLGTAELEVIRPSLFLLELGEPLECIGLLTALRGGEAGVKVDLEGGAERDDFAWP